MAAVSPGLTAARERLVTAQAEAQELENRQLRGELVPRDEVDRLSSGILKTVRSAMLAVPSRFASQRPHLTRDDARALADEIQAA